VGEGARRAGEGIWMDDDLLKQNSTPLLSPLTRGEYCYPSRKERLTYPTYQTYQTFKYVLHNSYFFAQHKEIVYY